jgi:hypothetical protein
MRSQLIQLLEAMLVDEWCTIVDDYGALDAPILDRAQVSGHPHTRAEHGPPGTIA